MATSLLQIPNVRKSLVAGYNVYNHVLRNNIAREPRFTSIEQVSRNFWITRPRDVLILVQNIGVLANSMT